MLNISRRDAVRSALAGTLTALSLKTAAAQMDQTADDALSIMESDPRFSDWVEILKFSGLSQYAQNTPRFTAFVPTNAAFEKYPDTLTSLLSGRSRSFPDTTRQVLFVRSHVILDLHPLSEFSGRTATVTSLAGNPIFVDGTKAPAYIVTWTSINSRTATAHLCGAPVVASNAIIYPVDNVVLST
jgi:uncharacterized surface protein with fasciclin (FAS1) repeats